MAINKHGLTINGLRRASGNTRDYGDYSPSYDELFYDIHTGDVWTVYQYDIGHNSYTVYHDPDIIRIGETSRHMTMQEIADAIAEAVEQWRYLRELDARASRTTI